MRQVQGQDILPYKPADMTTIIFNDPHWYQWECGCRVNWTNKMLFGCKEHHKGGN